MWEFIYQYTIVDIVKTAHNHDLMSSRWLQCLLLCRLLTNNGIFLSILQITNGDKVTLHHGNITAVITGNDGGLSIQCHLIVILHRSVLLVGDLQGAFGNVVNLTRTDG